MKETNNSKCKETPSPNNLNKIVHDKEIKDKNFKIYKINYYKRHCATDAVSMVARILSRLFIAALKSCPICSKFAQLKGQLEKGGFSQVTFRLVQNLQRKQLLERLLRLLNSRQGVL